MASCWHWRRRSGIPVHRDKTAPPADRLRSRQASRRTKRGSSHKQCPIFQAPPKFRHKVKLKYRHRRAAALWRAGTVRASAIGYLLDVSTNDSFSSYVDGYHDLDVGNVTGRAVTGSESGARLITIGCALTMRGRGPLLRCSECYNGGYCRAYHSSNVRQFYYQQPKRGSHRGDDQPGYLDFTSRSLAIRSRSRFVFATQPLRPDGTPLPAGNCRPKCLCNLPDSLEHLHQRVESGCQNQ